MTYTDATVANGTTYYYVVAAVNALGTGGISSEAAAKPAQTFAQWIAAIFPGQTDVLVTGTGADPDGDGIPNLAEYFYGTHPGSADVPPAMTCTLDRQGNATVRFPQAKNLVGVVCTLQQSADLVLWTDTGVLGTIGSDAGTYQWIQTVVPVGASSRSFFRLSISLIP